jgi:hypothetical protein
VSRAHLDLQPTCRVEWCHAGLGAISIVEKRWTTPVNRAWNKNSLRRNPRAIISSSPHFLWSSSERATSRRDHSRKVVLAVVTTVPTQLAASVARAWLPYLCTTIDVLGCGGARVLSRGSNGAVAARRARCAAPSCVGEHPSQGVWSDLTMAIGRLQWRRGSKATPMAKGVDTGWCGAGSRIQRPQRRTHG